MKLVSTLIWLNNHFFNCHGWVQMISKCVHCFVICYPKLLELLSAPGSLVSKWSICVNDVKHQTKFIIGWFTCGDVLLTTSSSTPVICCTEGVLIPTLTFLYCIYCFITRLCLFLGVLWVCVVLNPRHSKSEKEMWHRKLKQWMELAVCPLEDGYTRPMPAAHGIAC